MKVTSSNTVSSEYAVCNAGRPRWIAVQRARTIADTLGMQPASIAAPNSIASGAAITVQASSNSRPVALAAAAHGSTRAWPYRSTQRDTCGDSNA